MRIHSDVTTFESVSSSSVPDVILRQQNDAACIGPGIKISSVSRWLGIRFSKDNLVFTWYQVVFLSVGVILFFISLFFLLCLFMPARGEIGFTQCMPFPPPVMKLIGLHAHYFFLQLYYYAYIYGIFSRYEISCMHPSLSNFADIALSKAPTGRCQ